MNSSLPLVSVIIPAYNAEAFIERTLNSVLCQTYTKLEVVVVDDGSQDRTVEIVESIAQRDRRVILLQQLNTGVAMARNLAIENCSGECIAPIDADDIWYPEKIEKQVKCLLQAGPEVGLVYAWSVGIDEEGSIIWISNSQELFTLQSLEGEVYAALVYRNLVGNASVPLIRRACLDRVGYYNYKLKEYSGQGCEDWELYLRIAEYYHFRVVREFLVGYRQVTESMSKNYRSMAKSYNLIITDIQQRHPEIPNAIYQWSSSSFSSYLSWKSYACSDYWATLGFLYKAVKSDLWLILAPWVYKIFIKCCVNIVVEPASSLVWQDYRAWKQSRQRPRSLHQKIKNSDIYKEINQLQSLPIKPYDQVWLHRWKQILQSCQTLSSLSDNAKKY